MIVRIIKNWSTPDLMRQTPLSSGFWGGIRYTCDPIDECDVVIVLNQVPGPTPVRCAPENVWALMQEPYISGVFEWMVKEHGQYKHVFTHYPRANLVAKKYIRSHPAVPWHVNKDYDELRDTKIPDKSKAVSWITSNLTSFPGHKRRMDFLSYLQSRSFPIDIYGKGINFIEDKWDALSPYRYSLAIENSSGPDYWTEKIADCFLSWTVPIYFGCTNIEDYFPKESFIKIDINNPAAATEIIHETLDTDNWEARLPALEEARQLVLERYQFFPQLTKLINQYYLDAPKKNLALRPFVKRKNVFQKFRRCIMRLVKEV